MTSYYILCSEADREHLVYLIKINEDHNNINNYATVY